MMTLSSKPPFRSPQHPPSTLIEDSGFLTHRQGIKCKSNVANWSIRSVSALNFYPSTDSSEVKGLAWVQRVAGLNPGTLPGLCKNLMSGHRKLPHGPGWKPYWANVPMSSKTLVSLPAISWLRLGLAWHSKFCSMMTIRNWCMRSVPALKFYFSSNN